MKVPSYFLYIITGIAICAFPSQITAQPTKSGKSTAELPNAPQNESELGIPRNAKKGFEFITSVLRDYRSKNAGRYAEDFHSFIDTLLPTNPSESDTRNVQERLKLLINPDAKLSTDPITRQFAESVRSYTFFWRRPNGEIFELPRPTGAIDVQAYTDIYVKHSIGSLKGDDQFYESFSGGYYFSDTTGTLHFAPVDQTYMYLRPGKGLFFAFPGQAGLPFESATQPEVFNETEDKIERVLYKPESSKDQYTLDNGGPEALLQLSRQAKVPHSSGLNREALWKVFSPNQAEFSLEDVQEGAQSLGLTTQIKEETLQQLQINGVPALLFMSDDGRIITLLSVDDDRAILFDRGFHYNVSRSLLSKRYSGRCLTISLDDSKVFLLAENGIRAVQLSSLDAEVPQQFVLRNTGATPVTLQLEYPLLGVTESKLSKDVIAPGETATLDLKVKWRSILKAPYQNVLVSIQTNDPIVPRLQLAVLLTPPKAAGN